MLKDRPGFELLGYLSDDEAGWMPLREAVKTNPGIVRARALLDRAMLLAPRRSHSYEQAAEIDEFLRDVPALKALADRLAGVELDLAEQEAQLADFLSGKNAEELKTQAKASESRAGATFDRVKGHPGAVTRAVAAVELVQAKINADFLGLPVDPDAVVTLAERAFAESPSVASRYALVRALTFRASKALEAREPAYAELVAGSGKTVDRSRLLAVALSQPGPLRDRAKDEPDVRRARSLLTEAAGKTPDGLSPWAWIVLLAGDPPTDAARASLAREDSRIGREIDRRLNPKSPPSPWIRTGPWSSPARPTRPRPCSRIAPTRRS